MFILDLREINCLQVKFKQAVFLFSAYLGSLQNLIPNHRLILYQFFFKKLKQSLQIKRKILYEAGVSSLQFAQELLETEI